MVDACLDAGRGRFIRGGKIMVLIDEVAIAAGVGANDSVHTPFLHGHIFDDRLNGAGSFIPGVVGRHKAPCATFREPHPERYGIIFTEKLFVEIGRGTIAAVFIAVGKKMFQQRCGPPIPRVVALESLDERHRHRSIEEGVLPVTFLRPAPAWIAAQIRVWRKDDELVCMVIIFILRDVPHFVTFHCACLAENLRVPGFGHANPLRKYGRRDGWIRGPVGHSSHCFAMNSLDGTQPRDAEP